MARADINICEKNHKKKGTSWITKIGEFYTLPAPTNISMIGQMRFWYTNSVPNHYAFSKSCLKWTLKNRQKKVLNQMGA